MWNRSLIGLIAAVAVLGVHVRLALGQADEARGASPAPSGDRSFRLLYPTERYADPTTFALWHGFVHSSFQAFEHRTELGEEQVYAVQPNPRTDQTEPGFRTSAELVVSADLSAGTQALVEFRLDADDPRSASFPTAAVRWTPRGTTSTRLTFGRFWWPFGNVAEDWTLATSLMDVIPAVSAHVLPPQPVISGMVVEGDADLGRGFGFNYSVGAGTGLSSFYLSPPTNTSVGQVARLGLFPGLGRELELALSYAQGEMRETRTGRFFRANRLTDYGASFHAQGTSLRAERRLGAGTLHVRLENVRSVETLVAPPPGLRQIPRHGWLAQVQYRIPGSPGGWAHSIEPRLQWSEAHSVDSRLDGNLATVHRDRSTLGAGVRVRLEERFWIATDYHMLLQHPQSPKRTEGYSLSVQAEF